MVESGFLRLVSADSHVNLPPERVKEHLASQFHDAYDAAVEQLITSLMGSGAAKMNRAALDKRPHPAAGRPGYRDPGERLADMDVDGVEIEVLYSEVSAFRFLYMMRDGWQEGTRAFNDAMLEFAAADASRLIVSAQIPIHDVDAAVSEVRRVAALGCKSLQLPVFPSELELPEYYDDRYDAMWAAIQDVDLPVCFHIGLHTGLDDLARRDPTPMLGVMVPMTILATGEALGMWLLTGLLERFPRLRLVFVEPGLGWVSWYLNLVDDMVTRQGYEFPGIRELPSFYYHRNVHLTYIDEPESIALLRHRLGVENILWSSDYPHPISSWPNSRQLVGAQFDSVPDHERDLIVSGNAARVWNL